MLLRVPQILKSHFPGLLWFYLWLLFLAFEFARFLRIDFRLEIILYVIAVLLQLVAELPGLLVLNLIRVLPNLVFSFGILQHFLVPLRLVHLCFGAI